MIFDGPSKQPSHSPIWGCRLGRLSSLQSREDHTPEMEAVGIRFRTNITDMQRDGKRKSDLQLRGHHDVHMAYARLYEFDGDFNLGVMHAYFLVLLAVNDAFNNHIYLN